MNTRTIHQFDAIAALHVLRRWAVERVENHEGVTVLTEDQVIISFYPEYDLGIADENWVEFHTTTGGQWERKCERARAFRGIEDAVAIVVPTVVSARSTR
jgi:hypothetical protein